MSYAVCSCALHVDPRCPIHGERQETTTTAQTNAAQGQGARWRPSREHAMGIEYGTIERDERQLTISEACDVLNQQTDALAAAQADAERYKDALQALRSQFTHGGLYLQPQRREELCAIVVAALTPTEEAK